MKILEPGLVVAESGPFTGFLDLPMDARRRRGLSTHCDGCRLDITTPRFIGAFRAKGRNLKLCLECGAAAKAESGL